MNYTICYKELLFMARFRDNVCASSFPAQIGVFIDEPGILFAY